MRTLKKYKVKEVKVFVRVELFGGRVLIFWEVQIGDKCFDTQEKSVQHNKVQKTHNKVQKTHNIVQKTHNKVQKTHKLETLSKLKD